MQVSLSQNSNVASDTAGHPVANCDENLNGVTRKWKIPVCEWPKIQQLVECIY